MKAVEFPEQTNNIAKNQPEYETLPAKIDGDKTTSVWEFSGPDIDRIRKGEKLFLTLLNFGQPLQPVKLIISDKFPED